MHLSEKFALVAQVGFLLHGLQVGLLSRREELLKLFEQSIDETVPRSCLQRFPADHVDCQAPSCEPERRNHDSELLRIRYS